MRKRTPTRDRTDDDAQSRSEELAAAQIELEAVNAELQTLNRLIQLRTFDLHERSELTAGIVDAISVPTLVIGPPLRVLQANRAFFATFNVTAATTLGRPLSRVGRGEWHMPALRQALIRTLEEGVAFSGLTLELRLATPEPLGPSRWLSASGRRVNPPRPQSDAAGHPSIVVCCLEDVTERRRGALLLQAQIERLSATTTGLAIADLEQRISFANPALEAMTGYTAAELVGANLHRRLHPRRRDGTTYRRNRCPIVAALRQHRSASGEEVIQRRDGSFFPVSWSVVPIGGSGAGEALVEMRDISREKQILQRLLDSEKMAATGQMAAILAHEINNPLAVVNNALYILRDSAALKGDQRRMLETADEELQRVNRIVKNTLGLYRGASRAEWSEAVLGIENALALLDAPIRRKRLHVTRRWPHPKPEEPLRLALPPGDLRQLLANLIGNAIDAAPPQGRLNVAVRSVPEAAGGGARILIGDDGPGIAPELRPQIFQPFFTTKRERGTGLGLWIAAELARQYGGTIRIKTWTQAPTGTCFALTLPGAPAGPKDA